MSSDRPISLLNQGIAAYRDDRLDDARRLFAEAVLANPDDELGWIWFATVASDPHEQRYCIDRALRINPESPARVRLEALSQTEPSVPPELEEIHLPELPPDLQQPHPSPRLPLPLTTRRRPISTHFPSQAKAGDEPPSLAQRLQFHWYHWVVLVLLPLLAAGAIAIGLWYTQPVPYTIAIVAPLTGPEAEIGQEQVQAAQLAVAEINKRGGINDNPVELLVLDDGNDPDAAIRQAQQLSENDDVLFVIGHYDGDTTDAASAIYQAAGIPAINAAEATEAIVGEHGSDLYFSVVAPATNQGNFMAGYADQALGVDTVSIIFGPGDYGVAVADSFTATFTAKGGTVANRWDIAADDPTTSIAEIVSELATIDDPGLVVLALQPHEAHELLIAARRQLVDVTWFASPSLGYNQFPTLFANEPEEIATPGYFTENLIAASPLIYDSIGGPAMEFASDYHERYGQSPSWFGARVYDAVSLGSSAIDGANLPPDGDMEELRKQFTDQLLRISGSNAVDGLSSPLYFNPDHYVPRSLSVGQFHNAQLRSLPYQYRLVSDRDPASLADDDEGGKLMILPDGVFRQYQVIYTGVDINSVSDLDTTNQTFNADFFIWLRYRGDIDATSITFANATDPLLSLGTPLEKTTVGDETYVMYRVQGEFSQPMDFRNYPWDEHVLRIGFSNTSLSDDDLIYVADADTLARSQAERLLSGVDQSRQFNKVPSWTAERVWFSQEPQITRSVSQNLNTESPGYEAHSEFQVDITYSRTVGSFLVKELVPLALLSLVLYITLFFPVDQTPSRTGFAITCILTCSVLLQGIAGRLPSVGYTVVIEWWFYVFIVMSAAIILLGIVIDHYQKAKRPGTVQRLIHGARIAYPVVIIAMAIAYYVRFGMN